MTDDHTIYHIDITDSVHLSCLSWIGVCGESRPPQDGEVHYVEVTAYLAYRNGNPDLVFCETCKNHPTVQLRILAEAL